MFDLVVSGGIIVTMAPDSKPFIGSLGIKDGKIEHIKDGSIHPSEGKEFVDVTGKIISPGLINGHCHGDMTVVRGIADNLTLLEQNNKFAPFHFLYNILTDRDRFFSRQLTYIEALKSGTTFMTENMYWSLGLESVKAMSQTGIRGALVEDVRPDFTSPNLLVSEKHLKEFKEECEKNGLIPIIGSISEEDFDEELLKQIFLMAENSDLLVTQHLAETTWRADICKERFGKTPVQFLAENKFLSKNLIGSHAIYINDEEIKSMARANTKVINTPVCEMKISDGVAPIPEFLKVGIVTGLGTDGALWNNSNDMFREMKGLVLLHSLSKGVRSLNAKQALEMATINGARVFGVDNKLGSLEIGKEADFIIIDATSPHLRPLRVNKHENVISTLVYNVTGSDVESVFIGGVPVVLQKQLVTVDEVQIIEEVQAASEKIAKEIPEDAFIMEQVHSIN
ncbi:amidohydrolase family protein [Fredinandcohnia salidurans]|uniref:Amidohydrolase family protein n=1 Tax=Fredinandcohnia salidurans TaxID=2595041 RepID=A0ABW4MVC7_9BACI